MEEKEKFFQQYKGKLLIYVKEFVEVKVDLQEVNSIIGIYRVNIELLKIEVSGNEGKDLEFKFLVFMQKLK